LSVRHPRQFGACWLASRLWQELGLDPFFAEALQDRRGPVEWSKVIELLAVNRLCDPQSELGVHQRWFGTTAMATILGTEETVAAKDRLYRALDKALEHKEALETHLGKRWRDLFGARCHLLLYDLTSTYFEGRAAEVPKAAFGYSRDHRPDCRQLILALVVTAEGFPLSYEVFDGNRADVSTLEEILDSVERKHGSLGRVWVFDRGIVSEENLALLRRRGAFYLVATPKRKLAAFEQELLNADWAEVAGRPDIEVKLVEREGELYVLTRSRERAERERTIRLRALHGLRNDLRKLSKQVRTGRLRKRDLILLRLGRLEERWPNAWAYLKSVELTDAELVWRSRSQKVAQRLAPAGRLPVTDQRHPTSAGPILASVPAVDRRRGGIPHAQKRTGRAADLASDPAARRSAHFGRLPGLLLVGGVEAKVESCRCRPNPGASAPSAQTDLVGRSVV
jgi:hypothetical protein